MPKLVEWVMFLKRRVILPAVTSEPHFHSPEGLARFKAAIGPAKVYLEYGAGGSTVWASRLGKTVVSVDSDQRFMSAVRRSVQGNVRLIHGDIGLTHDWGKPLFTRPTKARVEKWQAYVEAPWAESRRLEILPDVVLIDGRFRAACVLQSILSLPPGSDTPVLVDDYTDRPHYRVVEQFAALRDTWGNMAEFSVPASLDREACTALLAEMVRDPR